jgi:hypothetical protein
LPSNIGGRNVVWFYAWNGSDNPCGTTVPNGSTVYANCAGLYITKTGCQANNIAGRGADDKLNCGRHKNKWGYGGKAICTNGAWASIDTMSGKGCSHG